MNEWNILIGLFRSTVEQSNYLTGDTQREAKMIFNRWTKEGYRLLKLIEDNSDEDYLDKVTDTIQDSIHTLRKEYVK